jgi:hypothetical protein
MDLLALIKTQPSLVFGPMVLAAVISGIISMWVGRATRKATSGDVDRKIKAEHETTQYKIDAERGVTAQKIDSEGALLRAKLTHETSGKLVERAWADYSLRRDIYLDLAKQINYLFSNDLEDAPTTAIRKREFLQTAQKVRLIGSDEVVRALNSLTESIKTHLGEEVGAERYSKLMNAIRKDIRTLNERPAVGTELDSDAFPIEG